MEAVTDLQEEKRFNETPSGEIKDIDYRALLEELDDVLGDAAGQIAIVTHVIQGDAFEDTVMSKIDPPYFEELSLIRDMLGRLTDEITRARILTLYNL